MGRVRAAARTWWVPYAVVAAALIGLQLLLIPMDRALGWDEAIYFSHADPDVPDLPFVASRARGIVVLIWPLVQLGLSLEAIRVVLAVASSAALVAAAACWGSLLTRPAAAATALVVGISWPFLVSGSEVMPNLWSAIILLAAGGSLARGLNEGRKRPSWWALGFLALGAFIRPFDAVVFAAGASVAVLWMRGRSGWLIWVGGTTALGCLPWLVETSIRFDGVVQALDAARCSGYVGDTGGVAERIGRHLAVADGSSAGPGFGLPALLPVVWWGVVLALGVAAAVGSRPGGRAAARMGLATGAALVGAYLVLVTSVAPRFLLDGSALLVAAGAAALRQLRRPTLIVLAAAVIVWGGWQVTIARDVARAPRIADVAPSILAADRPCLDTGT